MANVIRRYCSVGPSDDELDKTVRAGANVVGFATGCVDVQVDDAIDGTVETLDEFMRSRGFVLQNAGATPPPNTEVVIVSPNGTRFALRVDDLGVLAIVPLSP